MRVQDKMFQYVVIVLFLVVLIAGCKTLEQIKDSVPDLPQIITTTTTTRPILKSHPAYESLWPDAKPINDKVNVGPETHPELNYGGCDVRFVGNDSKGKGFFINVPRAAWYIDKDDFGNYVAGGYDFTDKDGNHWQYQGFRVPTTGNPLLTANPVTVEKSKWTNGAQKTARFYYQLVE